jgi:hypothetical protein
MNPMKGQEKYQGATADGFTCHRQVMDYALRQGCQALTIESVPGVMKAAEEYTNAAKKYGYSVYFLRLNSISFGVPQWRPRVWIIFVKGSQPFGVNLNPEYSPLSAVLQSEGTILHHYGDQSKWAVERMMKSGVQPETLRAIFEGEYGTGTLLQIGAKVLEMDDAGPNFAEVRKAWQFGGLFAAMIPRILHSDYWAPTILSGSSWICNGRPLLLEEYNLIMGFPKDYKWPEAYLDPRLYLSKGVCPLVATWILKQIERNLLPPQETGVDTHVCQPGELLDLCPKKKDVERALRGEQPEPAKAKRPRQEKMFKQPKVPIPRVKVQASDLAAQFLASLRRDDAQ